VVWWFGFAVAVGLMLGLYFGVGFIQKYVDILFLSIGIQHMIVLVILGFLAIIKERDDNIDVGNRVATMGYLHTLIGTSVALIMTSKFSGAEMIEHIDAIISPIGSALITSIIGWAFGKEMERDKYRYKLPSAKQSEQALEFLAQKVERSANLIEQSSQKWVDSIEYSSVQLTSSAKKLETTINDIEKMSQQSIERLNSSFELLYNQMSKNLEQLNRELEEDLKHHSHEVQSLISSYTEHFKRQFEQLEREFSIIEKNFDASLKDANRVFKNSIESMDSGLSKMNQIAKEWDRNLRSMKKFSTHSESALENLTEQSQKVINEFTNVAKSIPSASKVISEIDDFLSKLKREH